MEGRELTILPAIFQHMAAFNYNKAKDLADKERTHVGSDSTHLWHGFLACVGQLAAVERLYMNLSLLTVKGFLRRENSVRASYESLLTELTDLETRAAGSATTAMQGIRSLCVAGAFGALGCVSRVTSEADDSTVQGGTVAPTTAGGINALLWSLSSELLVFIRARICLIKFYEVCQQSGIGLSALDYGDMSASVADIKASYTDAFTQPLLAALHANLRHECDVLHAVMQALCSIQHYSFLSALLHLDAAHDALDLWQKSITCREGKKYSFSSSFLKGSVVPGLYQWLWQVRAAANAKFALYFYSSLVTQTHQQEMKTLLAKQPIDYVSKVSTFYRRCEASAVCVVLETSAMLDYRGPGYHLNQRSPSLPPSPVATMSPQRQYHNLLPPAPPPPSSSSSTPQRLQPNHVLHHLQPQSSTGQRYPGHHQPPPPPPPPPPPSSMMLPPTKRFERIFCYPTLANQSSQEASQDHVCWNSLLHYMPMSCEGPPLLRDNVLQVYHHQTGYTHYLRSVEPHVTLAVSYDCHRTDKESAPVRDFLNDLSSHLTLAKVFAALKPR